MFIVLDGSFFQFLVTISISRKISSFWSFLIPSANVEFILAFSVKVLTSFWYLIRFKLTSFLRASYSRALLAFESLADFRFFAIVDIFFWCRIQEKSQNSQEPWSLLGLVQKGSLLPELLRKHSWFGGGPGWPIPIGTEQPRLFNVKGPRA